MSQKAIGKPALKVNFTGKIFGSAVAARAYLVSLGISADRLRTVSYGKEFPFDPGHDEAAFRKNRRAHIVITAK